MLVPSAGGRATPPRRPWRQGSGRVTSRAHGVTPTSSVPDAALLAFEGVLHHFFGCLAVVDQQGRQPDEPAVVVIESSEIMGPRGRGASQRQHPALTLRHDRSHPVTCPGPPPPGRWSSWPGWRRGMEVRHLRRQDAPVRCGPPAAAGRGLAGGLGLPAEQPGLCRPLPATDQPGDQPAQARPGSDHRRGRDPATAVRRRHHRSSVGPHIAAHGMRRLNSVGVVAA